MGNGTLFTYNYTYNSFHKSLQVSQYHIPNYSLAILQAQKSTRELLL